MSNYDDIMDQFRPISDRRPHMSNADRAKQFSPFATLKGYEEALKLKQKKYEKRIELTHDAQNILDRKLHILARRLSNGQKTDITIRYFVVETKSKENNELLGFYAEITGHIEKINPTAQTLQVSGKTLFIGDVVDIQAPSDEFSEAPAGIFYDIYD